MEDPMTEVLNRLTVDAVRDLVSSREPVASVYVGLRPRYPTLDTTEDLELRWRALEVRLTDQGADEPTRTAVTERLAATEPMPIELALFAAGGRLLLDQPIPGGAPFDRADYAAPAAVVPLLDWWQRHPAYVAVVTDRTGADVLAVPRGTVRGSASVVIGPDDEIEHNAPGGWSQPRYQRRAVDSWRHNAAAVATATAHALRQVDAELMLVAGDVRAVQLLRADLAPLQHRGLTLIQVPGGRSPDGSAETRTAAVAAAIDGYAARQTAALLAALDRHGGPTGTAVHGADATLDALAAGRVGTLFVADHEDDRRVAWFGAGRLCAVRPVPGGTRGRLIDVAVRAALLTDAEVRIVPPGTVPGDLAALCRFRPAPGG
jgi:Bacterial archaeo-eukaryotic release factor family 2